MPVHFIRVYFKIASGYSILRLCAGLAVAAL